MSVPPTAGDSRDSRRPPVLAPPTPERLEQLAIELAHGAAEVVRAGRRRALVVDAKSTATDLVTEVDRESERWLVAEIARIRPGDAVLGEEGAGHDDAAPSPTRVRWVVDPIDGTVNFVLGIPHYAVSVAAEIDGQVVAGAVCDAASGETFHARLGGGAMLRSGDGVTRPVAGRRDVPLERAVIATGFAYDAAMRARQIAVVAPLLPRIADVRRLGSAALELCYLAEGRLDGYFEAGLNRWDYAAGALVATEAGCTVSGLRNRPPSRRFVAAAGAGLAAELFAVLEELDADRVGELSS